MRTAILALALAAAWSSAPYAAFNQPSRSPAQAACGGTAANRDFTASMISSMPASVCMSKEIEFEFAGQRLYCLPELDSYIASMATKRGKWGLGAVISSMGEPQLYLETSLTGCLGYAATRFLNMGICLSYNRVEMAEAYGSAACRSSGCGIILIPSSHWRLNLSVRNPFEPSLLGTSRLHRDVSAGVSVTRFEDIGFAVEISSRSRESVRWGIGEVYRVSSIMSISAGIASLPFTPSFGFEFNWRPFRLLYAYRYNARLGGTHIWGVAISR
jgi:hypothetical protein